jgi:hypothetical protein
MICRASFHAGACSKATRQRLAWLLSQDQLTPIVIRAPRIQVCPVSLKGGVRRERGGRNDSSGCPNARCGDYGTQDPHNRKIVGFSV